MSHRIWEGIRRDEYKFTELPKSVQEKEAKQAYNQLRNAAIQTNSASRIPEKDRNDFIRAYESGKREEVDKVLERESFKANMFRNTDSKEFRHSAVEKGREKDTQSVKERVDMSADASQGSQPKQKSGGKADLDISGLKLDGVRMAEAPTKPSVADIPGGATNGPLLCSR
jgi:hypothetical protein